MKKIALVVIAYAVCLVVQSDADGLLYGTSNPHQLRRHDYQASHNGRHNNAYQYDRPAVSDVHMTSQPKALPYYNKQSPDPNGYSTLYRHDVPQNDPRPAVSYSPQPAYKASYSAPLTKYQIDVNDHGYRYRTVNDRTDVFVYFQSKAVPGTKKTYLRYVDQPISYQRPIANNVNYVTPNKAAQINQENGYQNQYARPVVNFDPDDHKIDVRFGSDAPSPNNNLPYKQNNAQQSFSYQAPVSQAGYSQAQPMSKGFRYAQNTYHAPYVTVNEQTPISKPYVNTEHSDSYDDDRDDVDDRYRNNAPQQSIPSPYKQTAVPVQINNNYNNQQQTFSYQTPISNAGYSQYQPARKGFSYAHNTYHAPYVTVNEQKPTYNVENRPIVTASGSYDDDDDDHDSDDYKMDSRYKINAPQQSYSLPYTQTAVPAQNENNYNNRQQTFSYQTPVSQVSFSQYSPARNGFNYAPNAFRAPYTNVDAQKPIGEVKNLQYVNANNGPIASHFNGDDYRVGNRYGTNAPQQSTNLPYKQAEVHVQNNNYNNPQQTFSYQAPASQVGYAQYKLARNGLNYAFDTFRAPYINVNAQKPMVNLQYLNAGSVNIKPMSAQTNSYEDDRNIDVRYGNNAPQRDIDLPYKQTAIPVQNNNYNNAQQTFSYQTPASQVAYSQYQSARNDFSYAPNTYNTPQKPPSNPAYLNTQSVSVRPIVAHSNSYDHDDDDDDRDDDDHKINIQYKNNAAPQNFNLSHKQAAIPVQNNYNAPQQTFSYQTPASQVSYSQYQPARNGHSYNPNYRAPYGPFNEQKPSGYVANTLYANANIGNTRQFVTHDDDDSDDHKIDVRFRNDAPLQNVNLPYRQTAVPAQNSNYNNNQQMFSYETPASQVGYHQYQPVRKGFSYAHSSYPSQNPTGYAANIDNGNNRHFNSHDDDDDDDDDRKFNAPLHPTIPLQNNYNNPMLSNSYGNNAPQSYNYANSRPINYKVSRPASDNYGNNRPAIDARFGDAAGSVTNNANPLQFIIENLKNVAYNKPNTNGYGGAQPSIDERFRGTNVQGNGYSNNARAPVNYGNAQPQIDLRLNQARNGYSDNGPQNVNYANPMSFTYQRTKVTPNYDQPAINVRFIGQPTPKSNDYVPSSTPTQSYESPSTTPSTPAFETSPTPTYGTSTPAYGTSTPAYGTSLKPVYGTSTTPNYESSPTPAYGTSLKPAYGTSTTPTYGTSPTPAYGTSLKPVYGTSTTPTYGTSSQNYVTPVQEQGRYDSASQLDDRYKIDFSSSILRAFYLTNRGGNHGYGYNYGRPDSNVVVGFKSTLAENNIYKRNAGVFNESRVSYVNRRGDYDPQQIPYPLLQRPKPNTDGPLSTVGEPFVLIRKPDLPDDKGRQEYKLPELTNINSKETALRLANVNKDELFRSLYETNPEAFGLINPAKYAPLNVLGLPHKFRFDHPLGNFNGFPPKVYHGNFDLHGPVVDHGVRRGSGQFNDQYKFQRIYDTHPGTDRLVNPEQGGPLNVIGLPYKFRYPSPNGRVNGFRPPEVPTNKYLPGPVVDVLLDQPILPKIYPLSQDKESRFYSSQNAGSDNYNDKTGHANDYKSVQRRDDTSWKSVSRDRLEERLPLARYSQGPITYKRLPALVNKPSDTAQKINYNHPMIKSYVAKTKQMIESLTGSEAVRERPFVYSRPPIFNNKSR